MSKALKPFTVDHFKKYANLLVLDNGQQWEPEPFQLDVIADVFKGTPEVWMVVPEGNGKTTLMAGLGLYHGDFTPEAEVMMAASSRDQAEILFRQAGGFVRRTGMESRFRVMGGSRRIECLRLGGTIRVFAADERTGDGVIPTLGLIDELHRHRDLRLYRTWRGKLDKRGGQLVTISTAGEPDTEFEDTRQRVRSEALNVKRSGAHVRAATQEIVLHDWAVPGGEDVEDLKAVKQANPFTGVTKEILKRRRDSPTMTLNHWQRFVCNRPTRAIDTAIEESEWAAHGTDDRIPKGEPIMGGLDVAWKWDTTGLVPLWMPTREYGLFGKTVELVPPRDGTSLDPHKVENALLRMHERNPFSVIVMDMDRAEQLAVWIEENLGCEVVQYGQSHKPMGLAYERFMGALREDIIWHSRCPNLTRHALNAVAKPIPGGGARFDRPSSTRQGGNQQARVIDLLIAAAMVLSVALSPVEETVKPTIEVIV